MIIVARESNRTIGPLIAIVALSGFAGLGYEIVWTRLLANALGHEIVAVLGVLVALFFGLAAGSAAFGRRIAAAARPAFWYATLELTIGAWAVALLASVPVINALIPVLIPIDASATRQWVVAFAVPCVALLPATLAMGATLPALEAILRPSLASGRAVGWVYAANTFGAVIGTVLTTFWVMPALGLSRTLLTLAAINLGCALAILTYSRGAARSIVPIPREVPPVNRNAQLVSLFVSGGLGIGYEVVAVRTLSQILENTVYTFAALLSVYLLGTAIGAALHGWLTRRSERDSLTSWLCIAASLSCLAGVIALGNVDVIETIPHSLAAAILGELVMAGFVFLLPTIAMGALFTHLAQSARDRDGNLGWALAANTSGAALAPVIFGPVLFPLLGAKLCLVLIAAGYAVLAPTLSVREWALRAGAVAAALLLLLTPLSLRFVQIPPGGNLLMHRDGIMASVSVVEDRARDRHLEINNHFRMGGTASIRSDYREADIPLLLHSDPRRALFLGLGTGATISAAGDHPDLAIDGVELVPEVPETFAMFEKAAPNIGRNPNIHIHTADARRYVRAAQNRYDVVIADVYHPWVDGAGTLYTREHFAAIKALLSEDGLFCQWLPLHQLDLPTLRVIVRTFQAEFPGTTAYLAQFSVGTPLIALIGSAKPRNYAGDWFGTRVTNDALRARLASVDLTGDMALFGQFLADGQELSRFAGDGALNTDDRQIVTFNAPNAAYDLRQSPGERLLALLSDLHPRAGAMLSGLDAAAGERLADYWKARDRFLELGVRTAESNQIRDVVLEVAPKLIDIVRISADFEAAYRPALAMAYDLARTDVNGARRLLQDLDRASPTRSEAKAKLAALAAD